MFNNVFKNKIRYKVILIIYEKKKKEKNYILYNVYSIGI